MDLTLGRLDPSYAVTIDDPSELCKTIQDMILQLYIDKYLINHYEKIARYFSDIKSVKKIAYLSTANIPISDDDDAASDSTTIKTLTKNAGHNFL